MFIFDTINTNLLVVPKLTIRNNVTEYKSLTTFLTQYLT